MEKACVDDCMHLVRVKESKLLIPSFNSYYQSCGLLFVSDKFLVALDANSLYPTAMANYPVHNGKLEADNRIKTLEVLNPDYLYFCKVDVITPPTDLVFPILPVRHKDHIEWSAKIIYQGTYTSIDLFEASSRGYIIGNIVQCIVCKDSTTLLQSSLTQLYEKRVESQDPVMRHVLKLIMNSIYGRMGQKDIKTFYSLYRKNSEGGLDMTGRKQLYRCNVVSTEELVHDRGYLIEEVRKTPVLMPVNIAAEILSNSKVVMNKLIDLCGGIENAILILCTCRILKYLI